MNLDLERNLRLLDIVDMIKDEVLHYKQNIMLKEKNCYVGTDSAIITINASAFIIITAHLKKQRLS